MKKFTSLTGLFTLALATAAPALAGTIAPVSGSISGVGATGFPLGGGGGGESFNRSDGWAALPRMLSLSGEANSLDVLALNRGKVTVNALADWSSEGRSGSIAFQNVLNLDSRGANVLTGQYSFMDGRYLNAWNYTFTSSMSGQFLIDYDFSRSDDGCQCGLAGWDLLVDGVATTRLLSGMSQKGSYSLALNSGQTYTIGLQNTDYIITLRRLTSRLDDGSFNWRIVDNATGVPEPANWVLMVSGFGIAGGMLRRRRNVQRARSLEAYA